VFGRVVSTDVLADMMKGRYKKEKYKDRRYNQLHKAMDNAMDLLKRKDEPLHDLAEEVFEDQIREETEIYQEEVRESLRETLEGNRAIREGSKPTAGDLRRALEELRTFRAQSRKNQLRERFKEILKKKN